MHMGMPVQEIPRTLETGHPARDGRAASRGGLEEIFDSLVGQAGQAGEALAPTEEWPQAPRQGDDDMAMRHRRQDLLSDELAEGRLALGVTGGAEAALLAREREQILMAAVGAPDPGKAPGQHPTPVETLQGAGDDGPQGAVSRGIAVVVYVKEGVSMMRGKLPEGRGFLQVVGRRVDISLEDDWGDRRRSTRIVAIGAKNTLDDTQLRHAFDGCRTLAGAG